MKVSMIVAASENNAIGKGNNLLWQLPADLRYFKEKTSGHPVIMGRKTFESLGRPLPHRTNIVISRTEGLQINGCIVVTSLENALAYAKAHFPGEEVFIIGGGQVYKEAMAFADKIYLTRVHHVFEADTFFPELNTDVWKEIAHKDHTADEKHLYSFTFTEWERMKNV